MKPIKKDRCGYDGYTCAPSTLPQLNQVFAAYDFLLDELVARQQGFTTGLDKNASWLDNYLNIPVLFTGSVISLDHVLDMSGISLQQPSGGELLDIVSELTCEAITPQQWNMYENGGYALADYRFYNETPETYLKIAANIPAATKYARYTQGTADCTNCSHVFPPPAEDNKLFEPGVLEPMLDMELTPVGVDVAPYNENSLVFLLLQLTKWRLDVEDRLTKINNSIKHIWALRRLLRQRNTTSICKCFKISVSRYESRILRTGNRSNTPIYSVAGCTVKVNGESNTVSGMSNLQPPFYLYLNVYVTGKDETTHKVQYRVALETSAKGVLSVGIGGVRRVYANDGGQSYTLYEIQQERCRADVTLAGGDYNSQIDQSTPESDGGNVDDSSSPITPPTQGRLVLSGTSPIYPYVPYVLDVVYDGEDINPEMPVIEAIGQPISDLVALEQTLLESTPGHWRFGIKVTSLSRSLRFVRFTAKSDSNTIPGTMYVRYTLWEYIPDIVPDVVTLNQSFDVSVSVKDGSVLTAYEGHGEGLIGPKFVGVDENGDLHDISYNLQMASSWQNGVLSGACTVTSVPVDPKIVGIVMSVKLLDKESEDAALLNDDREGQFETNIPDSVHIYGPRKPMSIVVSWSDTGTKPPAPSAAADFKRNTIIAFWTVYQPLDSELKSPYNWQGNRLWEGLVDGWNTDDYSGTIRVRVQPPAGYEEYFEAKEYEIAVRNDLTAAIQTQDGIVNAAVPLHIMLSAPTEEYLVNFSKPDSLSVQISDENNQLVTNVVDPEGALQRGWTTDGVWQGDLIFPNAGTYIVSVNYINEVLDTATITIKAGTVIIYTPDYLHIFGPAKALAIQVLDIAQAVDIPIVSYAFDPDSGGSGAGTLVDSDYEEVDFTSGWDTDTMTWNKNVMIQASTSGYIEITASPEGGEQTTETFPVNDELAASISCPGTGIIGELLSFNVLLTDNEGAGLTRFDGSRVSVTVYDEDGVPVDPDPIAWDDTWSARGARSGSMAFSEEGTYIVKVEDSEYGVLQTQSVVISEAGDITVTVTSPLHIYGAAGTLSIVIAGTGVPEGAQAAVTVTLNGSPVNINDYLELAGGGSIDFSTGWNNGTWSQSVQAKTSASAAELVITATYGEE